MLVLKSCAAEADLRDKLLLVRRLNDELSGSGPEMTSRQVLELESSVDEGNFFSDLEAAAAASDLSTGDN